VQTDDPERLTKGTQTRELEEVKKLIEAQNNLDQATKSNLKLKKQIQDLQE
jgi:hypothetical protein